MPDLSHHVLGSSSHRSARQHAPWRKLACVAALYSPQAMAAAWRLGWSQNDTWLVAPVRHQSAPMPMVLNSPHATSALGLTQTTRRQLRLATVTVATNYSAEPQTGDSAYRYVSEASGDQLYSTASPQLSDFLQGNEGDCYFAASLAAVIMSDRDFTKV
jgi:hypothetical protein